MLRGGFPSIDRQNGMQKKSPLKWIKLLKLEIAYHLRPLQDALAHVVAQDAREVRVATTFFDFEKAIHMYGFCKVA